MRIYFDNNATTMMGANVIKEMVKWCNKGNPSSGYDSAKSARDMMYAFREYLESIMGVNVCYPPSKDESTHVDDQYKIIFTSGASEANCTALQMLIAAYTESTGDIPHVIMSAVEHKSLYSMAESYADRGLATVSFVRPRSSGHIHPDDIERELDDHANTCAVVCMHANNETGAINDIAEIGRRAHMRNVPFHCDVVQSFGKIPPNPLANHIDSMSISFHKFGGPPGIGALVVKQALIHGWGLSSMIFGSQNEGLRGGTENLPGIGAAYMATRLAMTNRPGKNATQAQIRNYIISELGKYFPTRRYIDYLRDDPQIPSVQIVIFTGVNTKYYLGNTILLSVVKQSQPYMCNVKIKDALERMGIIISVGSACNTSSEKASHVLYAMGADKYIRKGTLRISLGDGNTLLEAQQFIQAFVSVIDAQIKNMMNK